MSRADSKTDDLRRRALLQLALFLPVVAVLLFLPALTLNYWQAWVYWLVFSAACLLISLYLLKHDPGLVARRMNAGPAAEKEPEQKTIQAFAGGVISLLLIFPGLDHLLGLSDVPAWLVLLADVIVAIGFWIIFVTFKANSYAASTITVEDEQKVVTTGPYAVVRHPMYSGALLFLLATPIALGSWWGLLFVIPCIAGIVARLLDEERFLSKNLSGYGEYCEKTRYRLVPWVW